VIGICIFVKYIRRPFIASLLYRWIVIYLSTLIIWSHTLRKKKWSLNSINDTKNSLLTIRCDTCYSPAIGARFFAFPSRLFPRRRPFPTLGFQPFRRDGAARLADGARPDNTSSAMRRRRRFRVSVPGGEWDRRETEERWRVGESAGRRGG